MRLVPIGHYESAYENERSYRERLRLQQCDAVYIESAIAFGRNAAQIIWSQVEPVN
jgi:hypothetical protein